ASERRHINWNLLFEKLIFTPEEIQSMSGPAKRAIYKATLEAYADNLLIQARKQGLALASEEELDVFRGLNGKTARAMISAMQHDRVKLEHDIAHLNKEV
ncbi:hypothetical protein C8Q76DRAFT_587585, partial [Earliella scabrosa]